MFMYGFDKNGNRMGTLEKQTGGDCWRGAVHQQPVEAHSKAGAGACLRYHGAVRVVVVKEPIHQVGVIIVE